MRLLSWLLLIISLGCAEQTPDLPSMPAAKPGFPVEVSSVVLERGSDSCLIQVRLRPLRALNGLKVVAGELLHDGALDAEQTWTLTGPATLTLRHAGRTLTHHLACQAQPTQPLPKGQKAHSPSLNEPILEYKE